jgi:small multidrug resistance pump
MNLAPFLPVLIILSALLNTVGQSLLKLGSGQNWINPYLISGLFAYALSTLAYILVLGRFNLSMVYPVVIGLTVISTTFCGAFFLKEPVNMTHWMGIGLIISGVFAIAFGKSVLS